MLMDKMKMGPRYVSGPTDIRTCGTTAAQLESFEVASVFGLLGLSRGIRPMFWSGNVRQRGLDMRVSGLDL